MGDLASLDMRFSKNGALPHYRVMHLELRGHGLRAENTRSPSCDQRQKREEERPEHQTGAGVARHRTPPGHRTAREPRTRTRGPSREQPRAHGAARDTRQRAPRAQNKGGCGLRRERREDRGQRTEDPELTELRAQSSERAKRLTKRLKGFNPFASMCLYISTWMYFPLNGFVGYIYLNFIYF
jgi:hypothetical protein